MPGLDTNVLMRWLVEDVCMPACAGPHRGLPLLTFDEKASRLPGVQLLQS